MAAADILLLVGKEKKTKQMQTVMIPWVLYFYFWTYINFDTILILCLGKLKGNVASV
jgi:hypothetical protein